jgi:hypothetical protein
VEFSKEVRLLVTHRLKTVPDAFQALWDGIKNFEYRKDDRDPPFAVGDWLHCHEFDPSTETYSGRLVVARVSYVARNRFGIPDGYCVMALKEMTCYPMQFAHRAPRD